MQEKNKILLFLFTPFILNLIVSYLIASYVYIQLSASGIPPEESWIQVMKYIYTYNFYMSIIQIVVGYYAIKFMGGWSDFKASLRLEEFKKLKNIGLIITLFFVTTAIIWSYNLLGMYLYYGSPQEYIESWRRLVSEIPLWSKLYLVLIAPFTAGIFEEALWRWYGIEKLEEYYSKGKANLIQAIAFGLWHGLSLYALFMFFVGIIFGYTYQKIRRLGELIIAHIVIDIVGFSLAFIFVA